MCIRDSRWRIRPRSVATVVVVLLAVVMAVLVVAATVVVVFGRFGSGAVSVSITATISARSVAIGNPIHHLLVFFVLLLPGSRVFE